MKIGLDQHHPVDISSSEQNILNHKNDSTIEPDPAQSERRAKDKLKASIDLVAQDEFANLEDTEVAAVVKE